MEKTQPYQELLNELNEMRAQMDEMRFQLEEATDTIEAIRSGEIDALVVKANDGHQLFTLKSADQTYRIFIEQMTEGAVTLNVDGIILYNNSRFAALVGLPLEKVTGKPFLNFVTKDCLEECKRLIEKAWSTDIKGELSILSSTMAKVPVLISLKTLDLDEGLSLSVIITDLTEQKETQKLLEYKNKELEKAQEIAQHLNTNLEFTVKERTRELESTIIQKSKVEDELRQNEQRLQGILDTMAEGVVIVDLKGKLVYANPLAQTILDVRLNENAGNTFDDLQLASFHIDGSPLMDSEHPMAIMMATGMPVYDQEIAIHPPGKEKFYISINAAPIRNQDGQLTGGVGTFMDVTARRKTIQEKDDFISIASHELKTPVTSLKASVQLLERMKDNPSPVILSKLITQSGKSLEKLNNLINDLLNVNRISHGQLHLRKSRFSIDTLVNGCCQDIRTSGLHNLILKGDCDIEIYADEQRIEQVLVNFINNAVKYAPESKDIIILVEKRQADVKICVEDSGPGIIPEKIPHLFDRYYRVDSTGIQYSGLGLGLYICAEIIKKHGGDIGVNSQVGKGSSFWFTLPAIS